MSKEYQFGGNNGNYPPGDGLLALLQEISKYLKKFNNISIGPESIIVTNGATQAIFTIISVLVLFARMIGLELNIILKQPTWRGLPMNQARIVGAKITESNYIFEGGVWHLPIDKVLEKASSNCLNVLFLVWPSNPLGFELSSLIVKELFDKLSKKGVYTILDTTYEAMNYSSNGSHHSDFSQIIDPDYTFLVGSLSKTAARPDMRVGHLIPPKSFYQNCIDSVTAQTMGVSQIAQEEAIEYYTQFRRTGGRWFAPINAEFYRRAESVYSVFKELGFSLAKSTSTYYSFPRLPDYLNMDGYQFSKELVANTGVRLVAGIDFGGEAFSKYVRVSFGNCSSYSELMQALDLIRRFCLDQNKV